MAPQGIWGHGMYVYMAALKTHFFNCFDTFYEVLGIINVLNFNFCTMI